jgi:UDP-GlcNAc:undecaprenyl-phosphate/decaprenyl-phosphate GlcNAc-1-phosphate transferase
VTILAPAVAAGTLAFGTVTLMTEALRRLAIGRHLVDRPRPGHGHGSATPYLGGLAIVTAPLGTLGALLAAGFPVTRQVVAVVAAASAVSLLGLLDDLRPLSPALRLATECVIAIALAAGGGVHVDTFAAVPAVGHWADSAVTVGWIVIITNSFNLLDNMDGVAAAIAFVTSSVLAALALATGRPELAIVLIAMGAGCAGFLVHNWTPARIFMGDSGSLFLGFMLAASAVLTCTGTATARARSPVVAAALLLFSFVAVVDTCTVLVSRRRAGRRWNQGGTDHLAHRLRAAGLSTAGTAILLALSAACSATLGLLVVIGAVPGPGALAAALTCGAIIVALALQAGAPASAGKHRAPRRRLARW